MPDAHADKGSVFASDGYIVPNIIGIDIGCGMGYVQTNIPARILKETHTPSNGTFLNAIFGDMIYAHRRGKAMMALSAS